jgi:carbon-monoxide dehydrogenase iron sulfur subunit
VNKSSPHAEVRLGAITSWGILAVLAALPDEGLEWRWSMMRTVFVNPERCIGCLQCEIACAVEHSASQDLALAFREAPLPRKRVHVQAGPVPDTAYPNKCRHCDPAPCQRVCPTGAISRDASGDLVLIDAKRCIGCAMCAVVCPFDVLTFHPLAGALTPEAAVAVKCDGCEQRVGRGEVPACVESCKVDALVYGEINELMAGGRLRETGAVLAAMGSTPTVTPNGDPLAGWRSFGAARVSVNDTAQGAWLRRRRQNGARADQNGNGEGSQALDGTTREEGTS